MFVFMFFVVFVGAVLCDIGVMFWHSTKNLVVRRSPILGYYPRPKYVQRSGLPIFFDGRLIGFLKPMQAVKFVQVYEWQCRCSNLTAVALLKPFGSFCVAKIDTT